MKKPSWVGALAVALAAILSYSALALPAAPPAGAAKTTETVLSGNDWKLGSFEMGEGEKQGAFLPGFDDRAFRVVEVPGEVQRQVGLSDMDLYYQSKALTLINQKEWWYRKQFTTSKSESGKLLRMIFDGVDYFATVWLNGEKLGDHEGSYVPFSYNVTGKVRLGQTNVLAVKVTCPWIVPGRGFLEYMKGDWTTIDPENQLHINRPPFFLGPYWDAIPADGNAAFPMGLWRDVRLVSSAFSVIDDLFVATKSLNADGSATLTLSATINNYRDHDVDANLKWKISPENFAGESLPLPDQVVRVHPGENAVQMETKVANPQLWWTWDLGEPNLYKLTGVVSTAGAAGGDSREVVFGIRTIAVQSDMSYWLNGRRLFLKGAWYPMSDYYGSKPTRETFLKDLQLLKAANLNHLVAFTIVEKPEFYDLCDRLGILEIFEFPFNQDGPVDVLSYSNPRRETFVRESLSQVRQIIVVLRNHPSIIEWAAFAEAHAKGGGWGVGSWDFEQYGYGPYSEVIGKMVAELDPGTVYHPSLCDMGEQHFWMGNAGMGNTDSYNDHFPAQTGFVSEYGSLSLPTLESLKKELSPEDMWSEQNLRLPRWHDLPINISAYSYLSSFDYDGVASLLDRVNQYADRHIRSAQDLVDDSQLYQAFVMKYATEVYRRKKYDPVNGTRFWDYGEVWPGIRWGIIDYFRVPKMSYYSVKQAQARFALNFAYEDALESQTSGKRLQIPVWIINDHAQGFTAKIQCQIQDLSGHVVWNGTFDAEIPADGKKEVGIVDWIAPETPGVYVLRGQAIAQENQLQASASTFIKVTPRLFSRQLNLLLIGQKKYATTIAELSRAAGVSVDVIDEQSLAQLAQLRDAEQLRKKYDVVWLAAFDSLWKLLDNQEAEGLKKAIHEGLGFVHTGGRGSFHGGFGEGACLDFTPLADVLPVEIQDRYDLVLGEADERTTMFSTFSPLKDIRVSREGEADWSDGGLKAFGLPGFNDTRLKSNAQEILTVAGHPLLIVGQYGQGRTVAFTGFTPAYREQHADWDAKVIYPYLVDQQLYQYPVTKAYFHVFMEMLAAASGEKPQVGYEALLAAREKPLFETLKDLPAANVKVSAAPQTVASSDGAHLTLRLTNGEHYARLVRFRAEWDGTAESAPYLVLYDDNYFDLAPGESRAIDARLLFPLGKAGRVSGRLIVSGTNVEPLTVAIDVPGTTAAKSANSALQSKMAHSR
ncbi:MAG TPA: glycoside hydrolase family 2 TIM barrel-domain containing protein [Terriglobales bacterium]|nr:glycoside hydrolase family 2 TIM barrel-domain containing protein [Terriglobales bacterium]